MNISTTRLVSLLALSTLCLSAGAKEALNAAEIRDLFGAKTVNAYSEIKKVNVSLFYDTNGEVRGLFSSGKIGATKWWVKDTGLLCVKGKSGDLCFEVVKEGTEIHKYLVKPNGDRVLAFSRETFAEGNVNQY